MKNSKKPEQSRRSFIKTAGAGILLSKLASPAQAQQNNLKNNEKLPPERRLGWAVVGLVQFGTKQD